MKFRDLLKLNQASVLPDQERIRKRVLGRRTQRMRLIVASASACAAIALVAIVVVVAMMRKSPEDVILSDTMNIIESVVATDQSAGGLRATSALRIKTTESVSTDELKARISLSPAADYSVRRVGDCLYELRFKKELTENTLYNLAAVYNDRVVYRWAFQTETVFSITNTYPLGDMAAQDTAIEVTFSHAEVSGFEKAFHISPEVEGTFTHYGRTWAFVPSKPMKSATLYTVTIDAGVSGPDGITLEEEKTFSFTTGHMGEFAYLITQNDDPADTFLMNESPVAAICYNEMNINAAHVSIYRLADSAAYIDAYKKYVRSGMVSAEIMSLAGDAHSSFDTAPILADNYNGIYENVAFIQYPEPLPLGFYFAEIQIGSTRLYQLLQSTTLSVYTIATGGDYSVWVNDARTGTAVSGASVSLDGFSSVKTNRQGVASFRLGSSTLEQRFLTVENEKCPYIAVLNGDGAETEIILRNRYFTYLTTNSRLYRTTDEVGVFGVILPRKSGAKIPDELTLRCDFLPEDVTVKVAKDGSFTTTLSMEHVAGSAGSIELMLDDTWLDSTYFEIADYDLPTYHLQMSTDRAFYNAGETVTVTAQVTYMDGTPAAGIMLEGDIGGMTDENGRLTGSFIAKNHSSHDYLTDANYPEGNSVSCTMTDETARYNQESAYYFVVNSDCFLEGEYTDNQLKVNAYLFDLQKANRQGMDDLNVYDTDLYKGEAASPALIGEVHEVHYIQEPNGTTYDPINKTVEYNWSYSQEDNILRNFDISLTNGAASIALPEQPDDTHTYYVVLYTADRPDVALAKIYLLDYDDWYWSNQHFTLNPDKTVADVGEQITMTVSNGASSETINSGSVLYTVIAGEIIEHYYSGSARTSLSFKREYRPDVHVYGAYFDGKHIYDLGCCYLSYDTERARLNIEMEKDQAQYRPGDEVTLKFKVTDADGKPVSAQLNLSVMDRALYLLQQYDIDDPLYELYTPHAFLTEVYTTVSYRDFGLLYGPGGEGGGGGGPDRGNFEDTPFFETVKTDSNGEATVTFKLPDSVTEWKVLARAVTADVQAGMEKFDLVSTQGYFIQATVGQAVKTTDDLTVAVKSDGRGIPAGSVSQFQIGLTDRDGNTLNTKEIDAPVGQYAFANFGVLQAGTYTVYIKSTSGAYQDSVILTVTVQDADPAVWIHNQQAVGEGLNWILKPYSGRVTLTVTDENYTLWQTAMARLQAGNGDRVDQVLGRYLAEQFYKTGRWKDAESLDYAIISGYTDGMSVKLFPDYRFESNDAFDLRLSAKMAAAAPEFCSKEMLISSFERYLNSYEATRVDAIISCFGLAALGEPVLGDLQSIYTNANDLTLEETVYLALGFAYGGDYDTARYIFDQRLAGVLQTAGDQMYAAADGELAEDLTGCLSLLSNRLSLPSAEPLIRYIIEHDSTVTLLNLELISYLSDHVNEVTGQNRVMIATGGRNETYSYPKSGMLTLQLSAEQAATVRVSNVEGKSVVGVSYLGRLSGLAELGGGTSMSGVETPSAIRRGDTGIIRLELDVPADFELPVLSMRLPAGMRLDSGAAYTAYGETVIDVGYDPRTVQLPLTGGVCTVELNVRGILPGTYELEPILVTHSGDNRYMVSDPVQIKVTE